MASDAVFVPILPSFRDFQANMTKGTKGAGKAAGENIAKELEAAVSSSERAVTRAGDAAEKAQNKVADATGKVRVAQEQYNRALESGDPVKIAQSEERLESARRRQSEATTDAERKSESLTEAQERLSIAQDASAQAADGQSGALGRSALSAEEAEQASKDLDATVRILEVGLVAVGAAAIATAGYLVSLGDDFHNMSRDIRVGTGASGDALAGLEESALSVMQTVPNSMDAVGGTIADLNTRLGLTGEDLEQVTTQFLELENITGTQANVNDISAALTGFGIEGADASDALDGLFQVSQATGVEVNELASSLGRGGPALREFGFGLEDSAAMLGSLDKAGIEGDQVVQRLTRSLGEFAASGQDPQDALRGTVGEIENFMSAGDRASAYDLAEGLFGTRGAASFIDAVQTGTLSVEDFAGAAGLSDDTIIGLAEETRTLGEEFDIFKNQAMAELKPIAMEVFDTLRDLGVWARDELVPVLKDMAEWVTDNKDTLAALAVGVGTAMATFAAFRATMVAITVAQRAWNVINLLSTKGMRGLNAAMRANVIGLIVTAIAGLVAGLVWFFTQTEAGQRVWEAFTDALSTGWEWVKGAFASAWDFIQPIMDSLGNVFSWVGDIIGNVFSWMMDNWQLVVSVVFGPLGIIVSQAITHWDTLKAAIEVVWQAIQTAISWAWNAIIMPVWNAMQAALGALGSFFQWVWASVIRPAWDALGTGIKWVWDTIVKPVWDLMEMSLDGLGIMFHWVWNSVIKPAWDALGNGIQWVADNVVHPVFDGLRTGLELIETAFQKAVDWIGDQWDRIKGITAAPIKFVIDTIYNDGIRAVWNKVAGWLGLAELDPWRPDWLGDYASGGVLPGYTPGRDIYNFIDPKTGLQIGLGGGEGIMRPEFVDAVGGPAGIEDLNTRARKGMPLGHAGNYAAGGVLPGWDKLTTDIQRAMAGSVAQAFPNQRITSGTRYHDVGAGYDNHMQGRAVDFGLPGGPLASWIASEYGPSVLELFWDPGPNLVAGNPHGAIGGHSDHVHWAMAHIVDPYTGDVISQEGQGDGGTSPIGGLVRAAFDSIINPIMDAIPTFGGTWGEMPKALATKMVDGLRDFVMSKVPGASGGSSDHGDWVGNPGVEQFRGLVERLLRQKGHDVGLTGSVLRRMNQESTGDPNAINNWDSNAMAGWPTKGLMQMRDDTFASNMDPGYGNIWDPEHNLRSSLNYAMNEYGSISAAYDRAGGYDQGGYLMPGTTLSINETDTPEPVLTNSQWRDISHLVMATAELLDPLRILARDGRDMVRHIEEVADNTRRQVEAGVDAAGLAIWEALPGEVQDSITAAQTVAHMWGEISDRIGDKALAWSKGEWPIGSARIPTVEPGPGWQQFHLDDSLQNVARANLDLADAVIAGELSPGNDVAANALYDIFGRDPIIPDLARIASGGSNAIVAATEAAWVAFETGETARLEEWTDSTSQLTEAVLRARDAAIHTGQMVEGAVNGYLNWAMASDSQGRQGSWQEYFQHYGGQYGTAEGDWLLGQVGLGGILGGKFKDSFADLLIETAHSPLLAAPEILDSDGRVIGTQLDSQEPEQAQTIAPATETLTTDLSTMADTREAETDEEAQPAGEKSIQVEVTLPEGKSAFTAEEVEGMLTQIDEDVDEIKIKVNRMESESASVTSGVQMMV